MEVAMEPALRFTRKDYDLLPEDLRVELIDGQLLKMPSPTVGHQQILMRILVALVDSLGIARVLTGPVDYAIDDHNVLVPDLVVHREGEVPSSRARDITTALIVIEVLSPSTAARDRKVKREKYREAGAGEVWLIDPKNHRIELYDDAGERFLDEAGSLTSGALPGFELPLADLFG